MTFYAIESGLILTGIITLMVLSVYYFFHKRNHNVGVLLLLLSGFLLGLFMASIDPYLQNWDERFHALVAKNMLERPFTPMLRVQPLIAYNIEDWCCNHIWVHKQPLFLWQMALSMKLFGVYVIAIRLPSVLLHVVAIYFTYDIAKRWLKNVSIAYISALLFTVSFYKLELISGRFSLGHNDFVFMFYVLASIWAFIRFIDARKKLVWVLLIGFFVACAVLVKWLTGILIFGGWGLYLILEKPQNKIKSWIFLCIAIFVSLVIFLPWQIYISNNFPIESAVSYAHNQQHIFEVLDGRKGNMFFHFNQLFQLYGLLGVIFIPFGIRFLLKENLNQKHLSISFFSMIIVIYLFFTIVKTKMPSFTFPVSPLLWIIIGIGIYLFLNHPKLRLNKQYKSGLIVLFMIFTLQPWRIIQFRQESNADRNRKIHNTQVYQSLEIHSDQTVILNCPPYEDIELMFYQDVIAYSGLLEAKQIDSLQNLDYQFYVISNQQNTSIPDFYYTNSKIKWVDKELW